MRELVKLTYSVALCCVLAASAWLAMWIADHLAYDFGQELSQLEDRLIAEAVAHTVGR